MRVKEDWEKFGLTLNIQKSKIMASGPISSWQLDGETVSDFIFLGSKLTADSDCSHEIKRRLLLGRKVMTTRQHIKSRDITLLTKVRLVKAMVFPVVMYGCESWSIKKAECQRIDTFEMVGWHHWLDGRKSEQGPGVGDGQGSLASSSPWGLRVWHDWVTEPNWIMYIVFLCYFTCVVT